MRLVAKLACAMIGLAGLPAALAQTASAPARPVFQPDGTVLVPAFALPPSDLASKEAGEGLRAAGQLRQAGAAVQNDIASARAGMESALVPLVGMMSAQYPTDMQDTYIAGVHARIFTPKGKPADPKRVLINLHGGAFSVCAEACAKLESMPIAALGGFKVISVDYRMAPEFAHPAAVEDIAAVYRELLKSYKPKQIGIYGCSAGGALTAEAAAWLPMHGLPQAGAVGIFGAGGVPFRMGDSAYVSGYIDGNFPPPTPGKDDGVMNAMLHGYFAHADMHDPVVSPAWHRNVIAQFPPSLIITGERAMDMSPAIVTNSALLDAGVSSTLIVGEGMGHCFIYQANLPEARSAYGVITRFFQKNLD